MKELKLTENPAVKKGNSAMKGDGYIDMQVADYICPASAVDMNGKYRFEYFLLSSCPSDKICITEHPLTLSEAIFECSLFLNGLG